MVSFSAKQFCAIVSSLLVSSAYALDVSLLYPAEMSSFEREKYTDVVSYYSSKHYPNQHRQADGSATIALYIEPNKYSVIEVIGLQKGVSYSELVEGIHFENELGQRITEFGVHFFYGERPGNFNFRTAPHSSFAIGFISPGQSPLVMVLSESIQLAENAVVIVEQDTRDVGLSVAYHIKGARGNLMLSMEADIGSAIQYGKAESGAQIQAGFGDVQRAMQTTPWGTFSLDVPLADVLGDADSGLIVIEGSVLSNGALVKRSMSVPVRVEGHQDDRVSLLREVEVVDDGVIQVQAVGGAALDFCRVEFAFANANGLLDWDIARLAAGVGRRRTATLSAASKNYSSFDRLRVKLVDLRSGVVMDSFEQMLSL